MEQMQNARAQSPGRSRDDIAETFARAPQPARPFQSLMNLAHRFSGSTKTPHTLAGMVGGPPSRRCIHLIENFKGKQRTLQLLDFAEPMCLSCNK